MTELDEHVVLREGLLARLRSARGLRRFTAGEVLLEPGGGSIRVGARE
jgi:hypothetical protein